MRYHAVIKHGKRKVPSYRELSHEKLNLWGGDFPLQYLTTGG